MTKIVELIKSLPNMFPLKPATDIQINDAQLQLRVAFADEYKEYLRAFGAILADGIEFSGIAKSEHRNVVNMTQKEWELNPNVPHNMYVIENTCVDGIIIWQDNKGEIYQTIPNHEPKKIADSLQNFIMSRMNK